MAGQVVRTKESSGLLRAESGTLRPHCRACPCEPGPSAGRGSWHSPVRLEQQPRHRAAVQPVWCVAPRPGAVVPVEVFVEQDEILPVRVRRAYRGSPA